MLLKRDVLIILYKTPASFFIDYASKRYRSLPAGLMRVINSTFKYTQYCQLHGVYVFQMAIRVSNACH